MAIGLKLKFKKWRWPVFFSLVVALLAYWLAQIWLGPAVTGYVVSKEVLMPSVPLNAEVGQPTAIEVSSKVGGKVAQVYVQEGATVSAGQVLFTLEDKRQPVELQKARVATALAEAHFKKISEQTQAGSAQALQRAKHTVENAKTAYARVNELAAKGLVSREQSADALRNLTIAHSQLANLEFQAKAMRAQGSDYAAAEKALSKARAAERALKDSSVTLSVKAEFAGILAACKVAVGDMVLPGKTTLLIIPAGNAGLLSQHDVLSVPLTAVHDAEGAAPWVMLAENGRALRRTVKLGLRGHDKVEVVQGLREGDFVLIATAVEEGQRIRLTSAG